MTEQENDDSAWVHAGMERHEEPDHEDKPVDRIVPPEGGWPPFEDGPVDAVEMLDGAGSHAYDPLQLCPECERFTRRPGETRCRGCRLAEHDDRTGWIGMVGPAIADQARADVMAVQDTFGGGPAPLTYDEWVAAGRPTRPRGEDGRTELEPSDGCVGDGPRWCESCGSVHDTDDEPRTAPLAVDPGPLPDRRVVLEDQPAIGDRRHTIAGNEWFDGRAWRRVPPHPQGPAVEVEMTLDPTTLRMIYDGDRVFPSTAAVWPSAVASVLEAWEIERGQRWTSARPESTRRLFDALDALREISR
jgi:hypothetical protein